MSQALNKLIYHFAEVEYVEPERSKFNPFYKYEDEEGGDYFGW